MKSTIRLIVFIVIALLLIAFVVYRSSYPTQVTSPDQDALLQEQITSTPPVHLPIEGIPSKSAPAEAFIKRETPASWADQRPSCEIVNELIGQNDVRIQAYQGTPPKTPIECTRFLGNIRYWPGIDN